MVLVAGIVGIGIVVVVLVVVVVVVVAVAVLPLPHSGQVPQLAQIPKRVDRQSLRDRGSKANSTSRVLVEAPVVRKSHVTGAVIATVITA